MPPPVPPAGVRRRNRPIPADAGRIHIGSTTKTFTATVVLQLAAEHRVALDATVDDYLPGLIDRNGYDGRDRAARLGRLARGPRRPLQPGRHARRGAGHGEPRRRRLRQAPAERGRMPGRRPRRTTYQDAEALHRRLTASRLLTLRGARIHAVCPRYGDTCVDTATNSYFRTGSPPATDLTCGPRPARR